MKKPRDGSMNNHLIEVKKVNNEDELKTAQEIRYQVFVIGQNVPPEEEIDKYESVCVHFLAKYDNIPCGAARWRKTERGVKLERFAVLENYRKKGVGSALVEAVLEDVKLQPNIKDELLYLHSQISAMPLYEKFGFVKEGEMFQECDIDHFTMKKAR